VLAITEMRIVPATANGEPGTAINAPLLASQCRLIPGAGQFSVSLFQVFCIMWPIAQGPAVCEAGVF
jgi:hypothetical protein